MEQYYIKRQQAENQPLILDMFVNCHKCPPAHAKRITELVTFMVAKDLRSATIVDGEDLKRLLSFLELGYHYQFT